MKSNIYKIKSIFSGRMPSISDLSYNQMKVIAELVITDRLKEEVNRDMNMALINYEQEKETFINNAGHINSKETKKAYRNALKKLENYAKSRGLLSPLEFTPAIADDFIYNLKKHEYSSSTIRQAIATASSFYTFLERRLNDHSITILNPFRGTRARPQKRLVRQCLYPTENEVKIIIESLPIKISTIILCMAYRGLRVGAFPTMRIHGNRFTAISKGKEISGELPIQCIEAIHHLPNAYLSTPFKNWTAEGIEQSARYYIKKLFKSGKVASIYSVHDFRHFYAIQEYKKDRDIYRLSKLLSHASIQVTENYLRGLKVI